MPHGLGPYTYDGSTWSPANASAGLQTVANWATNISAGPADEASQTVSFFTATDNAALFAVPPVIAPNGTLTYAGEHWAPVRTRRHVRQAAFPVAIGTFPANHFALSARHLELALLVLVSNQRLARLGHPRV